MAVDKRSLPAFLANDADFRSWGSGIAAQLAAVGMVQTSDTGQINWGTVTRPAAGSLAGYEVWRFNDTLQASAPVFLRISYGTSSGAQDRPLLRIQTGIATNGAGTLANHTTAAFDIEALASKTAGATLPSYASGNGGRLMLATNIDINSSNFGILICLDRTRDTSGVANNEGLLKYGQSNANGCNWGVMIFSPPAGAGATDNDTGITAFSVPNPTWLALDQRRGTEEAVHGFAIHINGVPRWVLAFVVHSSMDATAPVQGTYLGGVHTFLSISTACGNAFRNAAGSTLQAVVYE